MQKISEEGRLKQLFESRFRGAANITGLRFQLAYSILLALDPHEKGASDALRLETLEEVDAKGNRRVEIAKLEVSGRHIQIKTSKSPWDFWRFGNSRVLQNFLPVWAADPEARLLVVTNFRLSGSLGELSKFCSGERYLLSGKLRGELRKLCEQAGHGAIDPMKLARRISFVHTTEEDLRNRIVKAITKRFEHEALSPGLFFSVLMGRFLDAALRRSEIRAGDLEAVMLSVQKEIDSAKDRPAIQNGWGQWLDCRTEEHPEDYYEGVNARPGHILAGVDVRRPVWEERIGEALRKSKICILRGSSGEGKSTLLYRYAFEHYYPETTFVVRLLNEEAMAGPLKEAVLARLVIGLPVLVLIDDMDHGLRFWRRLADELEGENVHFLTAVREEDWYCHGVTDSLLEIARLELSVEEARSIHAGIEKQGRLAAGARSADWAFERIGDHPSLLELTYLITHGRTLAEDLTKMEEKMIDLLRNLDAQSLDSFAGNAFADPAVDHSSLLAALTERCRHEPLEVVNRVAAALFAASEAAYFRRHKHLFDEVFEKAGSEAAFWLCSSTLPFSRDVPLDNLKAAIGEDPSKIEIITECARQFSPRPRGERFEMKFLQDISDQIVADRLPEDFSQIGTFLGWCKFTGANPKNLVHLLSAHDRQEQIHNADLAAASRFLEALHDLEPESYGRITATEKAALISRFKSAGDTLLIEERGDALYVEFIVDPRAEAGTPSEQALRRLRALRGFFPDYERYCSQGLYPSSYGMDLPADESRKELPREAFELEEDIEKNEVYLQLVHAAYAAQSVFEWQEQWLMLRVELLKGFGECIKVYEGLFRGSPADFSRAEEAFNRAGRRIKALRKPPYSMARKLGAKIRLVDDWIGSVHNFLDQYPRQNPGDPNQYFSRLMRHNLRAAIHKAPAAYRAFQGIIDRTRPYFDLPALDKREITDYTALADILDFWFERPSMDVPDLRKAAQRLRESRRKTFVDALRSTMKPLEDKSLRFTYPTGPLDDHPLVCVCLGFEILSFEAVSLQIVSIIMQLATFAQEFHLAYLAPLFRGSRYTSTVMRISADKIRRIAKGEDFEGKGWTVLPVEPPEGFGEVLPAVERISLEELDLISEFHEICGAMNATRNTAYLVRSRLDTDRSSDIDLAGQYEERMRGEYASLMARIGEWSKKMLRVTENSPAVGEWSEVIQTCLQQIQSLDDLKEIDPESFRPVDLLADVELQSRLNRYLDAGYPAVR